MENKLLNLYRRLAIAEGVSYLTLFAVTMPLKYGLGMLWPNLVVGYAHGLLFVGYVAFTLYLWQKMRWGFSTTFWLLLASLLPFGPFVADKKILAHL